MRRMGFTLVELLVVIAIIALLMAMLAPLLRNSREHTKATLCGSNIKQLVLGLAMYETENQAFPYALDTVPLNKPPGGYPGNAAFDRVGWWWFNHIADYCEKNKGKKTVLRCPSKQLRNPKLRNNVLCGNYGVNQSVCKSSRGRRSHAEFTGTPLGSSDIPRPAQTLLIVDSGYSMISWWHATDAPPVSLGNIIIEDAAYIPGLRINRERDLWPGQEWDAIRGRHPNQTVNIGFVDGHTRRIKADDLFVEKTNDGYTNLHHLWVPE